MKIRLTDIPLTLVILYLLMSPIQVAKLIESLGLYQGVRYFRFLVVIILIPILLKLVSTVKKYQFRCLFSISLPIICIWLVNILQLIVLPPHLALTHFTGSIKFTAFFLTFQHILIILKLKNAKKYVNFLSTYLLLVFFGIVLQYPYLAFQSGVNPASILSNFGQIDSRIKLFGLFGSSNEDANGSATLLPIALSFTEKVKGYRGRLLQAILLLFYVFVLLYNGSRTPLVISFPIIIGIFSSQLSIKNLLVSVISIPLLAPIAYIFNALVLSRAFGSESATEGTFGWRVEQVWTPALGYVTAHSPLFGFGARGWEYVSEQAFGIGIGESGIVSPHNTFIWAYATWGILGLVSFISFIVVLLSNSFKTSQSLNPEVAKLSKATFCSMIVYILWSLIANSHFDQGWTVLISLASLIASLRIYDLDSSGIIGKSHKIVSFSNRCSNDYLKKR